MFPTFQKCLHSAEGASVCSAESLHSGKELSSYPQGCCRQLPPHFSHLTELCVWTLRTSVRPRKAWVQSGHKSGVGQLGWTSHSRGKWEEVGVATPLSPLSSQSEGLLSPHGAGFPKGTFLFAVVLFSPLLCSLSPSHPPGIPAVPGAYLSMDLGAVGRSMHWGSGGLSTGAFLQTQDSE